VPESIVVFVAAFLASTLASVTGFGGGAVLIPLMVAEFGVRDAVPIMTVGQLVGNVSRAWFTRRQLEWPVVGWFSVGAVPLALLGGALFASAPLRVLIRLLGAFLVLVVVWRHIRPKAPGRPAVHSFALVGAGASFLSALLGTAGPVAAPFFLSYGLVKGAYIGTEALTAVVTHMTKLVAYRRADVLSDSSIAVGLLLGVVMIAGSFVGTRIVNRLPERLFVRLVEAVLVLTGLWFLIRG
jgi:uncharacterized protein